MNGLELTLGGQKWMRREVSSRKDFGPGAGILIFCASRLSGYVLLSFRLAVSLIFTIADHNNVLPSLVSFVTLPSQHST
jgi:hypothetical protein